MLHNTSTISGSAVSAVDGSIGHVEDTLFHDETWNVRYFVIDTGPWILGRRLLCSAGYAERFDDRDGRLRIDLTRDQVEASPELEADLPVSELKRREFTKYKKGPVYWSQSGVRKEAHPPGAMPAVHEESEEEKQQVERELYGKHLRSAGEVTGYTVEASDKPLGSVVGLLVDDDDWSLRYIAVEAEGSGQRKMQIYSPDWVETIRWIEQSIHIKFAHDVATNAPPLEDDAMVSRDYEKKLYDYYGLEAQ